MEDMKLIYPAFSKHNFYFREHISKYILEQRGVPLNPFMIFQYFMLDSVDREVIRDANRSIITKVAEEVWVFGQIADGVLEEIRLAKRLKKPLRYFEIVGSREIKEISRGDVKFEEGLERFASEL